MLLNPRKKKINNIALAIWTEEGKIKAKSKLAGICHMHQYPNLL